MDNDNVGCLVAIAGAFMAGVIFWNIGYDYGHSQGVKAHARGEYVVVQMPDGTEQVCKVKEAPDGK
jgi:hypothetical protein